jgi:hypothetical protein
VPDFCFTDSTCHKSESPNAVFIKNVISGSFTQSRQCNRSHQELYYTSVTTNLYKEIRGCCLTSTLFVVVVVVVVVIVTFNCCILPCYVTIIITTIIPFQHSFFSWLIYRITLYIENDTKSTIFWLMRARPR